LPPVDPFWFKTATVWHKAILASGPTKTVIALCGFTASFHARNKAYQDTETRPYAGAVCKKCDSDNPTTVMKRAAHASTATENIQIRKSKKKEEFFDLTEDDGGEVVQSTPRPGRSYDDAVRRKPRRILP
jgi:hypothetical protein